MASGRLRVIESLLPKLVSVSVQAASGKGSLEKMPN